MVLSRYLLLALWALSVEGFYLPILKPTNFCKIEGVENPPKCQSNVFLHVNKLDSTQTIFPYEYSRFDFCPVKVESKDRDPIENLGQVVFGDRLRASAYEISFAKNEYNKKLCDVEYDKKKKKDMEFLRERIHESYMHQWVIDNMPVTWCYQIVESDQPYCTTRFPVGCYVNSDGVKHDACYLSSKLSEPGATYLFNHHKIVISYHYGTEGNKFTDGRIVRAQIQLKSCESFPCGDKPLKLPEKLNTTFKITYSYSIEFEEASDIRWASRWDYILSSVSRSNVQMFSIINSSFLILVLLIVCIIICGVCHYKWNNNNEEPCGDMMAPPPAIMLLSVFTGNGVQLTCTAMVALVFASLGFLSPPNRGALTTAVLVIYPIQGFVAGYVSAAVYKLMGGLRWKSNVLMTSFFISGIIFGVFFTLNLFLWYAGSSAAIPFTTLLALLCLWFGISVPLTFFGAFISPTVKSLVSTKSTPQETSTSTKMCSSLESLCSSLICGIVPFGCIFIQAFFLLNSIWSGSMYYQPGYDMLAFLILLVACVVMSTILFYISLCLKVYHWGWRTFFSTGGTAFYLLLFSIQYFFYRTTISGFFSSLLFFGYTFIMVFLFFLLTGSIGVLTSVILVWKMSSMRDDGAQEQDIVSTVRVDNKIKTITTTDPQPQKEIPPKEDISTIQSQDQLPSIHPQKESLQDFEDSTTL